MIGSTDHVLVYYGSIYAPGYVASPYCRSLPLGKRGGHLRGEEAERAAAEDDWTAAEPIRSSLADRVKKALVRFVTDHVPNGQQMAIAYLADVHDYLSHRDQFCDTNRLLRQAIDAAVSEHRPVVLIAHSLGTLITFSTLGAVDASGSDPLKIARVVTIGSQLGLAEMPSYLLGRNAGPAYTVPRSMQSWVNAVGADDPLAWPARDNFVVDGTGFREIFPRTEPNNAHSAVGYLMNPLTATAIAAAWCNAFVRPSTAPARCAGLTDVADRSRDP